MAILLSAGFAGFYYLYKYDNGKSLQEEIVKLDKQKQEIEVKIEEANIELTRFHETDEVLNDIGNEINKFLEYIPNKLTSAMILNRLNTYSKSSGVDMEDINNHPIAEQKDFYEKLKITMTIRGVYTQVLVFLSKLTSATEIITVEDFTIREVRDRERTGGLFTEVTMRMDIYGYRYIAPIIDNKQASKEAK